MLLRHLFILDMFIAGKDSEMNSNKDFTTKCAKRNIARMRITLSMESRCKRPRPIVLNYSIIQPYCIGNPMGT